MTNVPKTECEQSPLSFLMVLMDREFWKGSFCLWSVLRLWSNVSRDHRHLRSRLPWPVSGLSLLLGKLVPLCGSLSMRLVECPCLALRQSEWAKKAGFPWICFYILLCLLVLSDLFLPPGGHGNCLLNARHQVWISVIICESFALVTVLKEDVLLFTLEAFPWWAGHFSPTWIKLEKTGSLVSGSVVLSENLASSQGHLLFEGLERQVLPLLISFCLKLPKDQQMPEENRWLCSPECISLFCMIWPLKSVMSQEL